MKEFNFIFKGNIFFGNNSRNKIHSIIKKNKYKSVCIVIDHALVGIEIFEEFLNSLSCDLTLVACDISEPTYKKLEEKRIDSNNKNIDVFIGIGGGSALDMAKGLSVLYANSGPALDYRGFNLFKTPIKPIIAIPTTAGTGSEITPNASFIDSIEKKKMGINGESIRPKYAILDPELTISCPRFPTVSAGVDSLVHATEAFVALKSNPMAKMFAKEGFKLVFENLPLLADDLKDIELREKVMYGAFLSAVALMNSGTGPAAAMSYPLGVHFGVPHGIGGGIFLPHVIEHNINEGFFGYVDLYPKDGKTSKENLAHSFLNGIKNTWAKLDVPHNLDQYGLNNAHIKSFVSDTMDLKGALDQNPVSFHGNEIRNTLELLLNSQYE